MIALFGFLLAGLFGGLLYFALLRWNTTLYVDGSGDREPPRGCRSCAWSLSAVFSHSPPSTGALPLLLTALGVLIARPLVVRWMP